MDKSNQLRLDNLLCPSTRPHQHVPLSVWEMGRTLVFPSPTGNSNWKLSTRSSRFQMANSRVYWHFTTEWLIGIPCVSLHNALLWMPPSYLYYSEFSPFLCSFLPPSGFSFQLCLFWILLSFLSPVHYLSTSGRTLLALSDGLLLPLVSHASWSRLPGTQCCPLHVASYLRDGKEQHWIVLCRVESCTNSHEWLPHTSVLAYVHPHGHCNTGVEEKWHSMLWTLCKLKIKPFLLTWCQN